MIKQVQVILGSDSDEPVFLDSKFEPTLKRVGIGVLYDIASAHRHPARVKQVCETAWESGVRVFVGVAGKAAHLTGAIAAHVPAALVIGIPLKTEPFGIKDAMLAMLSMPAGRVVVPVLDFYNAALVVASVLAIGNDNIAQGLVELMVINDGAKPPQLGLDVAERRQLLAERRKKEAADKEKK